MRMVHLIIYTLGTPVAVVSPAVRFRSPPVAAVFISFRLSSAGMFGPTSTRLPPNSTGLPKVALPGSRGSTEDRRSPRPSASASDQDRFPVGQGDLALLHYGLTPAGF